LSAKGYGTKLQHPLVQRMPQQADEPFPVYVIQLIALRLERTLRESGFLFGSVRDRDLRSRLHDHFWLPAVEPDRTRDLDSLALQRTQVADCG